MVNSIDKEVQLLRYNAVDQDYLLISISSVLVLLLSPFLHGIYSDIFSNLPTISSNPADSVDSEFLARPVEHHNRLIADCHPGYIHGIANWDPEAYGPDWLLFVKVFIITNGCNSYRCRLWSGVVIAFLQPQM